MFSLLCIWEDECLKKNMKEAFILEPEIVCSFCFDQLVLILLFNTVFFMTLF